MNIETLRDYCLSKPGAEETLPFGPDTLVFKVIGKAFLLVGLDAEELRDKYESVQPGYHMNKKHWNTIMVDGSVSNAMLKEWIDHSYSLVAPKPKKK